jgi:tRNA pseudouridine55 synthase
VSERRPKKAVHGVLVLDKPLGPTSHDVVAAVRRHFGTRRVGHAGTLDPMATGVLVVLLGEATKLSAYLTRDVKRYVARVAFGSSTDTLDAQGRVTRVKMLEPGWLTKSALESALHAELERTLQVPPRVSAIKVAGQAAYERARRGEELEMEPRDVELHEAVVRSWDEQSLEVELLVSKGYYVRSFARDLGDSLGVPAHLAALRRTASGPFTESEAHSFPLGEGAEPQSLYDVVRRALPTRTLTTEGLARAQDGKQLRPEDFEDAVSAVPPPEEMTSSSGGSPDPGTVPPGDDGSDGSDSTDDDSTSAPVPPELNESATVEEPNRPLVACLHGDRLVALATVQPTGILKIVRGIHDPGLAPRPDDS